MFILRNCHFVSALTEDIEYQQGDVLLDQGKIMGIAPCGADFGVEAEELDAQGKTLLPGLIDMHIHLFMQCMNVPLMDTYTPAEHTVNCLEYATALLDAGFTTIRDVGDNPSRPTIALSRAIDAGRLAGPTIVPSGPILCPTAIGAWEGILDFIDGTDSVRKAARLTIRKGAKFLKLYGSGSMMAEGAEPGFPIIEPDEIREAVMVAKRYGTYAAIHCHGAEAIDNAVRNGVRTIEHASLITEETLQYMDEHRDEVGIVPTLSVTYGLARDGGETPAAVRARKLLETICGNLKNAYRHQVQIGWGTDVNMMEFKRDPMQEFRLRKELLDYSNKDILKQATINSAKLMCMDDRIGSVKIGKNADLILVDGDPVKDISVMYQKPAHVIKAGCLIR